MKEKNCQVISVINFKGGVGKSTVTFNLGSELSGKGYKVLLIDFDAQGNLTRFSGVSNVRSTITDALYAVMEMKNITHPICSVKENLDIIACNVLKEKWMKDSHDAMFRELTLKRYVDKVKEDYDYDIILIDNAPSIGLDVQNSLYASDKYLVVSEADMASLDGVNNVLGVIGQVVKYGNHNIESAGIIVNKFEAHTNLHTTMLEAFKQMFGNTHHIYSGIIPKSIDAGTSSSSGIAVSDYKKNSKIAESYSEFADEFVDRVNLSGVL